MKLNNNKIFIYSAIVFILLNIIYVIFFYKQFLKNYYNHEDYYQEVCLLDFLEKTKTVQNFTNKKLENGINILDILEFDKLIFSKTNDVLYFDKKQNIKRPVIYNNSQIYNLQFSPSKNRLGFFINNKKFNTNLDIEDNISLITMDIKENKIKKIDYKSYQLFKWNWFSNNEILISQGCGTECQALHLVDIILDKKYELQYGVGYEWSPNKEMVLAYHYTTENGIIIGDRFGNILFRFIRKSLDNSDLINLIKASWSSDDSKIALVIKKEEEEKLELLVFDVKNNFKKIFQSNIDLYKDIKLIWNNNSNKIIFNNQEFDL